MGKSMQSEGKDKPRRNRHVDKHADDVVCDGYKRPCRNSGIYFKFFKSKGHERSENRGKHHHAEYRGRNGYCRHLMSAAKGKEIVEEHQQGDDTAIEQSDPEFLEKLPCRLDRKSVV